ncbi:MAG: lipase family protein [Bacteroidota bacterium]
MDFITSSNKFETKNATSLAKAANIVYLDWDSADTEIKVAGFKQFKYFDREGTQAFVAANEKHVVVAFRGTEANQLEDIITDLKVHFTPTKYGKLHSGFYHATKIVIDEICDTVAAFRNQHQSLWITGHSLGAALATIAIAFLQDAKQYVNGLYTFGQPRVGDEAFAEKFNIRFKNRTFRIVNNSDIVTRVPMRSLGYSHIGTHIYLDNEEALHIDKNLTWWFGFTDRIKGRIETFKNTGFDDVSDHAMDNYLGILHRNLQIQSIA